jgi:beta-lactamase superfamily II metal-dependent hydrolase/chitodextrinase
LLVLLPALALAGPFRFTTIDIGQGDGAVVVAPSGCAALLDGGPTGSGATIKAYLKSIGVTSVDFAIMSHHHADHLGGIDEVDVGTDAVPITTVYDRGGSYSSSAFEQYASHFSGRRSTVSVGQVINLCSEVQFRVVAVNGNGTNYNDENSYSVVVKISWGSFDAVVGGDLTGDASKDMESRIASSVGPVELYKVHHHGSRYSSNSTFLNTILPKVSFFSVGFDNTYGHPTQEAMDRISATGSAMWQTEDPDRQRKLGHIELTSTDGLSFTVKQGSTTASYTGHPPADSQPPTAPANLTATAAAYNQVDLTWSASSDNVGVTSYQVNRSTNGGGSWVSAGTSTTTGFADLGLSGNTTYTYQVTARDAAGNVSPGSNLASATTPVAPSPAVVFLNEVLANEPGSSTAGEFIEVLNTGGQSISIAGWTLRTGNGSGTVRHTFASGTTLAPRQAIAVFGQASGIPSGTTGAIASSTGNLGLTNSGQTVSLRNASGQTISSVTYGSSLASQDGVSMNRSPDASSTGAWVLHNTLSSLSSSPAENVNGGAF